MDEGLAFVAAEPVRLAFRRVPEPKQVKNRLHLDVQVVDAGDACAWAIALGAQPTGQQQLDDSGDGYVVLRDPEGNEFCFVVDNAGDWERLAIQSLADDER